MAVTHTFYDNGKANLTGGTAGGGTPIDWLTDTIKVALVTNAYTPNVAADDFWNDVSGSELASGNGYTTGGNALASKTTAVTGGNADYDCADPSWTFTATKTFRYAVFYKDTGTASTSPLMSYVDFGADQNEGSTFTLTINGSGLFRLD
jgi:hypothetical protein